jgi:hypothetical protein
MIKIKRRQENTTQEKTFIGSNFATPEYSTGRCPLADIKSELEGLFI